MEINLPKTELESCREIGNQIERETERYRESSLFCREGELTEIKCREGQKEMAEYSGEKGQDRT